MRNHGWAGDLPRSDDDAARRIVQAARTAIERGTRNLSISVVARDLGVTRQTVYRYFRSVDDLLLAAIVDASEEFFDRVGGVVPHGDLDGQVVEAIAYTVEAASRDPYLAIMVGQGRVGVLRDPSSSSAAVRLGRMILDRMEWPAGIDGRRLDELAELMLRLATSLRADPGTPSRTPQELRAVLRRWVAPVVHELVATVEPSNKKVS